MAKKKEEKPKPDTVLTIHEKDKPKDNETARVADLFKRVKDKEEIYKPLTEEIIGKKKRKERVMKIKTMRQSKKR